MADQIPQTAVATPALSTLSLGMRRAHLYANGAFDERVEPTTSGEQTSQLLPKDSGLVG